jgi:hypothetical protein
MAAASPRQGWSWAAFFLGPVWYLQHGLSVKGLVLLLLVLATVGLALPIVCVYAGLRARGDEYERWLAHRGQPDLRRL